MTDSLGSANNTRSLSVPYTEESDQPWVVLRTAFSPRAETDAAWAALVSVIRRIEDDKEDVVDAVFVNDIQFGTMAWHEGVPAEQLQAQLAAAGGEYVVEKEYFLIADPRSLRERGREASLVARKVVGEEDDTVRTFRIAVKAIPSLQSNLDSDKKTFDEFAPETGIRDDVHRGFDD